MKNIFFTLLLCLFTCLVNASPIKNNISHIEKVVLEKMKLKNLSAKETLIIYMLAGREFFNYKMYNKSEDYYLKVLEINSNENKSEAYLNLISISLLSKDQTKTSLYLKNAKEYFSKNTNFKNSEVNTFIDLAEGTLEKKFKSPMPSFYGHYAATIELQELIKSGNFSEALSYLNPEAVSKSNDAILESTYDLLNVLVNKTGVKKLICSRNLEKYPDSLSYSIMICDNLNYYLKNKKLSDDKLKKLNKYFERINMDKNYLYFALLKIRE